MAFRLPCSNCSCWCCIVHQVSVLYVACTVCRHLILMLFDMWQCGRKVATLQGIVFNDFDATVIMVAFIINIAIDLDLARFVRRDRSNLMKKNTFVRFCHCDVHYYVIISHNTSVPMIGHLELATGMLTSHVSWEWLIKICPWSQIFLRCVRADLDLIVNAERFARIWLWMNLSRLDRIDRIVDYECNQFWCCLTHDSVAGQLTAGDNI